jgi:hypothetical protein
MSIFLHKMRILYTSCAHIILIDWEHHETIDFE